MISLQPSGTSGYYNFIVLIEFFILFYFILFLFLFFYGFSKCFISFLG
jgi:hypothetical protein